MNLNVIKNRIGMEMAINTVIILLLSMIVLVVVATFFLGTTGSMFGPLNLLADDSANQLNAHTSPVAATE